MRQPASPPHRSSTGVAAQVSLQGTPASHGRAGILMLASRGACVHTLTSTSSGAGQRWERDGLLRNQSAHRMRKGIVVLHGKHSRRPRAAAGTFLTLYVCSVALS
jgi:hypothetical protein